MKFRQYVGEKPKVIRDFKDLKKIVQTKIGPTEKGFLDLIEKEKPTVETYLGFGLSKNNLKRVFDYIKSWLIRYDIQFESINPYLTIYLLDSLPSISILIDNIKNTKKGILYKPKGTITIISPNERDFPRSGDMEPLRDKDQIILNYVPNLEYHDVLEKVFDSNDINIVNKFCHVKLFEVETGILTPNICKDIMYGIPKLPDLRLGTVGLLRRR